MSETKKVKMGERAYQGAQCEKTLHAGQVYEMPGDFADWLVKNGFATVVRPRKGKKNEQAKV